jgi:hypothetical protein
MWQCVHADVICRRRERHVLRQKGDSKRLSRACGSGFTPRLWLANAA